MKTCTKCGGPPKPITEFHKNANRRDGLQPICKECNKSAAAKYRAANPEKAKASNAKYYATNQEKRKADSVKWQAANRDKVNASAAKRYAANPDKKNAATAKWAAANPEKVKAAYAKWRAANTDKRKALAIKWYAANLEKAKARAVAWNAAHPEIMRIHCHNRRARQRANGGVLSKGLAGKLFKLQRGKCACGCGQPLGTDYHLDHIMPVALGGTNTDDNIQLLTATCNMQKSAKHPVDFMQQRGFLL